MVSHLISLMVLTCLLMAAAALYLLPVLVGWARHVPGLAPIAVINVFLGWTFIGWVTALALALAPVYPAAPVVQVVQPPPPPAPVPPPSPYPGAGWAGPPGPPPPRLDSPPPLPPPPGTGTR